MRLYDRLFTVPEPAAEEDFLKVVNPKSLEVITAKLEPSLATAQPGERYQFERLGYFSLETKDAQESAPGSLLSPKLIFNRTITLRDTWAKA